MIDKRNKKAKKFPVVFRVSHRQVTKNIQTGYKVSSEEWDESSSQIKEPFPDAVHANADIAVKKVIAQRVISLNQIELKGMSVYQIVEIIIWEMKRSSGINVKEITHFKSHVNSSRTDFYEYGQLFINRLKKAKRDGYAMSIEATLRVIKTYKNKGGLFFSDITPIFIKDYEAYCQGKGNKINTYAFHLRNIRTLFNLAIKDQSTEVNQMMYPFASGGYSIKTSKSKKRAVKESTINAIRQLDLIEGSEMWNHRNYFLFMFNLRGMNFIDLSFLKAKNISEGRIKYTRKKTKKEFDIKLTEEANKILAYYIKNKKKEELIFPVIADIITKDTYYVRKKYMEKLRVHNKYLKRIAKEVGEDVYLSSYVTRHSFATIGLRKGLSKSTIGDMLGHSDYNVTEKYFAEFDYERLDQAAEAVFS